MFSIGSSVFLIAAAHDGNLSTGLSAIQCAESHYRCAIRLLRLQKDVDQIFSTGTYRLDRPITLFLEWLTCTMDMRKNCQFCLAIQVVDLAGCQGPSSIAFFIEQHPR